jgi:uncharacterized protein (TIGR00730 family)
MSPGSNPLRAIAVFCGSSTGARREYRGAAVDLGETLAARGIELVYGGGKVGLMGVLADAALAAGGRVTGVMPQHLVDREVAHRGLHELIVVSDMHERKATIAARSDAFLALPGGPGTMEEFFEAWVWRQLGLHAKPVGLLNVAGYYDPLTRFFDRMVDEGFMAPAYRTHVAVDSEVRRLLDHLAAPRSQA